MAKRRKYKPKNNNNTLALFVLLLIAFLVVIGMTSTPAMTDGSATGEVKLVINHPPENSGEVSVVVKEPTSTNTG
jgi:hypothetical protein